MQSSEDTQSNATLLAELAQALVARNLMLVTIESCTGGGVAHCVTTQAGSSNWFDRGWVTYSDAAKSDLVNVDPILIHTHGAVSEPVARAMVRGALKQLPENRIAVSITGIAGPDGGSVDKPVGTVYFAWATGTFERVEHAVLSGDREAIREQSITRALAGVLHMARDID
ncbi:MAG: competence damage-inducible protein A [marine bacterium B5-7]|nr:MAG: competence damage-inducible protein A [marine bacterium B5-7]